MKESLSSSLISGRQGLVVHLEFMMGNGHKRRLCRKCFKNFARSTSPGWYCSLECKSSMASLSRCNPKCSEQDMIVVPVQFINNTEHYKRVCRICGRGDFVPHRSPILKDLGFDSFIQKKEKKLKNIYGESFYTTNAWLKIRFKTLMTSGAICNVCGSTQKPLHVDHIKPRSKYPDLALDITNLQVLCSDCNLGKGADVY